MNIPQLKTEEWVEVLEPFQQNLLNSILAEHTEDEALQIWLQVSGPEHTKAFGGNGIKDYLKNFKAEFNKLILGDEKYSDKIREFNEHTQITKFFVVSFLSSVLAESLGIVSGVVAPLVVLVLGTIGKIGLNAYRNLIRKKEDDEDKKDN